MLWQEDEQIIQCSTFINCVYHVILPAHWLEWVCFLLLFLRFVVMPLFISVLTWMCFEVRHNEFPSKERHRKRQRKDTETEKKKQEEQLGKSKRTKAFDIVWRFRALDLYDSTTFWWRDRITLYMTAWCWWNSISTKLTQFVFPSFFSFFFPPPASRKHVSWLLGRDGDVSVSVIGEVDELRSSKLLQSLMNNR